MLMEMAMMMMMMMMMMNGDGNPSSLSIICLLFFGLFLYISSPTFAAAGAYADAHPSSSSFSPSFPRLLFHLKLVLLIMGTAMMVMNAHLLPLYLPLILFHLFYL
jgi:hypothetical protein